MAAGGPAEKTWLILRGNNQLPKLITGVKFGYGIEQQEQQNLNAVFCLRH
jgi:hypothetical protein